MTTLIMVLGRQRKRNINSLFTDICANQQGNRMIVPPKQVLPQFGNLTIDDLL